MKKLIYLLVVISTFSITFSSCKKDDSNTTIIVDSIVKSCYVFSYSTVQSVVPPLQGFPKTIIESSTTQCNLTEKEAQDFNKSLVKTTTMNDGGYLITITTTSTYKKQ